MKKLLTRLILWNVSGKTGSIKRNLPAKDVRVTTLRLFLKRLLEDEDYCVFSESADLKHPVIKHGEAGVNMSSDGERLLICRALKKYEPPPLLWFIPRVTREYTSLSVLAIASVKDQYAHIQWLDETFAQSCAILYENLGRTFYLMYCTDFTDRVRFNLLYSWNPITHQWDEETKTSPKQTSYTSNFIQTLQYYWRGIME